MSTSPTREEVNARAEEVFELYDLSAPKVSGPTLRFFSALLELPWLGAPLRNRILVQSGFMAFRHRRDAANDDQIKPTALPVHYPLPSPGSPPKLEEIDDLFHALSPSASPKLSSRPTIRDYYEAYKSGRTTPTKVAQTLLQLIHKSNQSHVDLNAVICTQPEDVLAEAGRSTERWANGAQLSVLDGVPFTVKIHIDVAKYPSHVCSNFLLGEDAIQTADADIVKALRQTGMVMVGKTNMDELGICVRGYSMFTGQTRNPHNTKYVPGGSSGGAAAAVAAGLCPVTIGSDAAGSIRIPAALCGVFGLKPTFLRISTFGRALSERDEQAYKVLPFLHFGPLAGCAEDLALMYYVMAGLAPHRSISEDPQFVPCPEQMPRSIRADIAGLRVGICLPWVQFAVEPCIRVMRKALDRMVANGAVEVPIAIPDLEDVRVGLSVGIMDSLVPTLKEKGYYGDGAPPLGFDPRSKLRMGHEFLPEDELRAKVIRTKAMEYCVKELFEGNELDVIITPAIGSEIPLVPQNLRTGQVDVKSDSKLMAYAIYPSYTGVPACAIPIEKDESSGLPHAIQLIAAPWNEKKLLEICMWAEKEFDTRDKLNPMHCYNPLAEGAES